MFFQFRTQAFARWRGEKSAKAWSAPPKTVLLWEIVKTTAKRLLARGTVFCRFRQQGVRGDLEVPDFAAFGQMLQNVPALRC